MEIFAQQIVNGLVLGSIYALVALGYTMVYGILGLINFAHGDITMIGALVSLTIVQLLAAAGVPAPVVLVLAGGTAVLVCAILGLSIERIAYRPLRRAPRLAPLITAIGVSILLQYSAALIWGKQYISLPQIIAPAQFTILGAQLTSLQAAIFLLACLIMAGLLWFIKISRMGRAMRATEQNPDVAGLMGVNTNSVIHNYEEVMLNRVFSSSKVAVAATGVLHYTKWSKCSQKCGRGVRTRHFVCKSRATGAHLANNDCDLKHMEALELECNLAECVYMLKEKWSKVRKESYLETCK